MARPLRILFCGAYYHVINRGRNRQTIFHDDEDCDTFLYVLRTACELYCVDVIAYCLMTNHYHLVIKTPKANLPDFMRHVNSAYTLKYNNRYKGDGSIFKGRYKSILAQDGAYVLKLIHYTHRNPVKAGIVKDCSEYKYSSHNNYLVGNERYWLKFIDTLRTYWKNDSNLIAKYKEFMKLSEEEVDALCKTKRIKGLKAIIYGDDKFIDQIKANYLDKEKYIGKIPSTEWIQHENLIEQLNQEVIRYFAIEPETLYNSIKGIENVPRMLVVKLCRELTGLGYKEISEVYKFQSVNTTRQLNARAQIKINNDKKVLSLYEKIKGVCK